MQCENETHLNALVDHVLATARVSETQEVATDETDGGVAGGLAAHLALLAAELLEDPVVLGGQDDQVRPLPHRLHQQQGLEANTHTVEHKFVLFLKD